MVCEHSSVVSYGYCSDCNTYTNFDDFLVNRWPAIKEDIGRLLNDKVAEEISGYIGQLKRDRDKWEETADQYYWGWKCKKGHLCVERYSWCQACKVHEEIDMLRLLYVRPPEPREGYKLVRIAVAINDKEEWVAAGSDSLDPEQVAIDMKDTEEGENVDVNFVEAEIPIPRSHVIKGYTSWDRKLDSIKDRIIKTGKRCEKEQAEIAEEIWNLEHGKLEREQSGEN